MQTYRICDGVFGGHARLCNGCRLLITHKAIYVGICTMHSACAPAHHPMRVRKHTHAHNDDADACSSVLLIYYQIVAALHAFVLGLANVSQRATNTVNHFQISRPTDLAHTATTTTAHKALCALTNARHTPHIDLECRAHGKSGPEGGEPKKTQARPHNPWQSTLPNSRSYIAAYMYSEQSHVLGANCERHFGC